jgi:hypothetical protein
MMMGAMSPAPFGGHPQTALENVRTQFHSTSATVTKRIENDTKKEHTRAQAEDVRLLRKFGIQSAKKSDFLDALNMRRIAIASDGSRLTEMLQGAQEFTRGAARCDFGDAA